MAGPLAVGAEIIDRPHDPDPEQMMPQAIDDHPRRQQMVGMCEPSGELQPTTLPAGGTFGTGNRDDSRKASRHALAGQIDFAAFQEWRVGRLLAFRHAHG